MKKFDPAKLLFGVSCAFLVFASGFIVRHYKLFPYSLIEAGIDSVRQVFRERETLAGVRPMELTQPARGVGKGLTVNKPGAEPGLTFISSFFPDGDNEMRLMRLDGSIVNRWPVRLFKIFPNRDHIEERFRPQSEWNVHTHGALALPDGSIVFTFEGFGTVKLDRCGAVLWTLPRMTHHSLESSQDGGFWIPAGKLVKENSPFPLLKPPYNQDLILKVSADGKVVDEISILDVMFKNGLGPFLFSNGLPGVQLATTEGFAGVDPTHLNDVEELTSEMASSFPQFRSGDLLLSLRNLNMIMVIDPVTKKVKWHQTGPWLKQHDPDFQPTGRISVYNNNDDGTETGSILGGSQIMEINPATGETSLRYGGIPEQQWYSFRRGKHQYLSNGNVLIADSESGRVIEVTPSGEIVWEYVNRYDDKFVAVVRGASRYSDSYFNVKDWKCDVQ
jgi:hypothetical protein